jgi:hypothetical protein
MKLTEKELSDMALVELAISAAGNATRLSRIVGLHISTISRYRNGQFRNKTGEGLTKFAEMCFVNAEKCSRLMQENAVLKRKGKNFLPTNTIK